ncbi:unnamed protein product [Rotaria sp. Silwood2]|nr:unnamed protein product [Rotaria sp. Silwood2]
MFVYHIILSLIFVIRSILTSQIDIDIPSIATSHIFEISSNISQNLNRDVLFGLVDGTSSSIPSSILVRASYKEFHVERFFNLYQSNNKNYQQQIQKEPIFRSYLLASSFNRSYPFIRVLIGSVHGSYEHMNIQPMCAIVTAVNEQNLYETQACFISPHTGYCLVTISVLKMVEYVNKNQTKNKIELYLKLHHVISINECISDHTPKQDHIHHETRIGHVEYIDNDNILFSTITRSSISIDYPIGIHYPDCRLKLGQQQCTDDRSFSQNDLSCEIIIVSNNIHSFNNNLHSSSYDKTNNYVILKNNNNNNNNIDHHTKTSPFLIALSILLGTCIVLVLVFALHWLVNFYYRQKSNKNSRRQRHSTQSGAEEVNHDWIFLDRNSLEMPTKQTQQQENSLSIHNSTLHITPNPIINTSTLPQQKDLSELTHLQMIAYFENLKESHA